MSKTNSEIGHSAMILAAGLGKRMRPLTDTRPKPLIDIGGRSLIDRTVDRIRAAGIERVVVNMHYLAEQIEDWARHQPDLEVILSDERTQLLDTGGGVTKALTWLGDDPFFVLNSDSFWVDGCEPALERLRDAWDPAEMDCLLLLSDPVRSVGFDGPGDFSLHEDGRLTRNSERVEGCYIYCGCYLVSPKLFSSTKTGAFSMNILWDNALGNGRLFGLVHDGLWLHVGTPEAIKDAEAALIGQP